MPQLLSTVAGHSSSSMGAEGAFGSKDHHFLIDGLTCLCQPDALLQVERRGGPKEVKGPWLPVPDSSSPV